jgi:hypothetical protein
MKVDEGIAPPLLNGTPAVVVPGLLANGAAAAVVEVDGASEADVDGGGCEKVSVCRASGAGSR